MKGTKDSWKGRDEEDSKLETKTTKNANHGAHQVWEVPSMWSGSRDVAEYIGGSQELIRAQAECCGIG
jgi:hypothetical protein